MKKATFWKLIETAKAQSAGCPFHQIELLQIALEKLGPDEIIAFDRTFGKLKAESYRRELWAAAYVIQGGCGDDGFEYFRAWLVAQGQKVYEAALADPETLVDVIDPNEKDREEILDRVGMDMVGIAWRAYEAKTGKKMPVQPLKLELTGPEWVEGEADAMYPKLCAKFG